MWSTTMLVHKIIRFPPRVSPFHPAQSPFSRDAERSAFFRVGRGWRDALRSASRLNGRMRWVAAQFPTLFSTIFFFREAVQCKVHRTLMPPNDRLREVMFCQRVFCFEEQFRFPRGPLFQNRPSRNSARRTRFA